MDDCERMRLEKRLEILFEVDVLTGAKRRSRRGMKLFPLLSIAPRKNVFRPRKMVFLKATEKLYAVLIGDVPEVVYSDRHFPADDVAHIGHILLQVVEPCLGDVDAGMSVCRREKLERLAAHRPRVPG